MIRLLLDPYDTFSPYNRDNWQRIRKSRWTCDDGFEEENDVPEKHRLKPGPITALARIENRLALAKGEGQRKKNRWGSQARTKLTVDDMKQFSERVEVINKITSKLLLVTCLPEPGDPFLEVEEPPPEYDVKGQRINTLEYRYREKLEKDRNILIYQLLQLNPTYTIPAGYKPPQFERVIWFPVKEYPEYNFIGAILGPRGNTQKRLEKTSGCKIAIRGKAAEKTVIRKIRNPITGDIEEMPHHIYLTASNEENLEKGIEAISPLLKPQNELVRLEQMKELALINGTYRFDIRCKECGEMGHKDFQCPLKQNTYFANVQCEKCGDLSHVTKDCPQQGDFESTKKEMDQEYDKFLQDINGTAIAGFSAPAAAKTTAVHPATTGIAASNGPPKVTLMMPRGMGGAIVAKTVTNRFYVPDAAGINEKRNFI